jgi:hypothetical protein
MSALRASLVAKAQGLIGSKAELIRFGHLSVGAPLEGVAILRLGQTSKHLEVPVSRLIILRLNGSDWTTVFDAGREMTNPAGYVGLDYIDDDFKFEGYDVALNEKGSDAEDRFTLYFTLLGPDPGWPTEVGWNKATGRYQEMSDDARDKVLFTPELKDPPHRKPCNCADAPND